MHFQKFADDTNLCYVFDMLEGRDAIQRGLNKMRGGSMQTSIQQGHVHVGWGNSQYQHGLGDEWIDSSHGE